MHIGIYGCGWLGLPLAQSLISQGHQITGSRRPGADMQALIDAGIKPLEMAVGIPLSSITLQAVFKPQLLIINIPYGRKQQNLHFTHHLCQFISSAYRQQVKAILFISSTSVYGNSAGITTEQQLAKPQTLSAKANYAVEQHLRQCFGNQATVLRLAGLVGPSRHPISHLAGKKGLSHAHSPVNLVHLEDVIQAIGKIVNKQLFGHTLHLSSQQHPTRQQYYCWSAKKLGLPLPEFTQQTMPEEEGKCIDAQQSCQLMGLTLAYPSPYDMLP